MLEIEVGWVTESFEGQDGTEALARKWETLKRSEQESEIDIR